MYIQTSPGDRLNRKALFYLCCSGVFMGLAIAVKWSAVFAGLSLGVQFAMAWYEARWDYADILTKRDLDASGYKKDLARTIKWGLLFFVATPMVIYCLSYIPFARSSGLRWPDGILQNQVDMFGFHANLAETPEFLSQWWTWPFDALPVAFYTIALQNGTAGGIYAFGNPALWWGGFLALIWCVKRSFKDKDKTARFLCVAWVAQIFPWAFITRASFIYHYFPCVPFLALMTAYIIKTRLQLRQWRYALTFGTLALIMFAVFYPVLGGKPIADADYIKGLQWLPGWQFIK